MKILMTADPIGGVWSYATDLCAELRQRQAQVTLAVLGRRPTPEQRAHAGGVQLHESDFRLEWMPDPWEDLRRAGDWLLELEREYQPDIVHLNHLVHADLPWHAPVLSVGHSCVLSWCAAVQGKTAGREWDTYRRRVTASLQAASCVVAPTRTMLTALRDHYGPFQEASVIHNGRAADHFMEGVKERLVLSAGRVWDGAKNVAALAAVAAGLNARVVVAGETMGPYGDRVDAGGLEMLGALDQKTLASWYSRAAIYALPARYEPFGLTALEAALCGCALVLGDIPSLREVWGAAAFYVDPEDHEDLRYILTRLLENDLLRREMSQRAVVRAREFTLARFGRQYLDLYRQIQCASPCFTTH